MSTSPLPKLAASPSKGCLMLMLPEVEAKKIRAWGKENITSDELVGDGLETEIHTTALYGFDLDVAAKDVLSHLSAGPMKISLGKIKRFKADDNRPDSDVLVIEVKSEELNTLNAELKKKFNVTSFYKTFNPHVTLGYVKPGALPDLNGEAPFDEAEFDCGEMIYSTGQSGARDKTTIKLDELAKQAADPFDGIFARALEREGGHSRVTFDSGGVTKGGIAETSGRSAAEIRALTPEQIRSIYRQTWDTTGAQFPNAGAGEIYFDHALNAGAPKATKVLQATLNRLRAQRPPLPVTGHFGPQTRAAVGEVDPAALAARLHEAGIAQRADLVARNPAKYQRYDAGWKNRATALGKSPLVAPLLSPAAPVKVKGTLQPQPVAPVKVKGTLQVPASVGLPNDGDKPSPTPAGAVRSLPMLSAPAGERAVKGASNAFARAIAAGLLKGPQNLSRLADSLPAGVTRQIGKAPLGRGMEGAVYKGFTGGGVGNTAIKTFFDSPRALALRTAFLGQTITPGPWAITGGAAGVRSMLGKGSISLRASLMKSLPALFPAIHGGHARGYVTELLKEIPIRPPTPDPRHWLKHLRNIKQDMANVPGYMKERTRGDYLSNKAEMYQFYSTKLRESFKARHRASYPEEMLNQRITDVAGRGHVSGMTLLPFKGKTLGVGDFIPEARHNVMLNSQGKAVISDPMIQRIIPPGTPARAPRLPWDGWAASPVRSAALAKQSSLASALRKARNDTHIDPTEGQAEAGNYRKGRMVFRGIPIAIENPKGTTRSGKDKGGKAWSQVMSADYGYFTGSKAVDGDAVDCFIGPDHDSDVVVVIDQYKGDTFDESKFVLAVASQKQGEKLYLAHYPKGWKLGPVSTTTLPELRTWLKSDNTKTPFHKQIKMHTPVTKAAAALALVTKLAAEEKDYSLYYFEGRNTGIAARSEEEARSKKRRGGEELVAVRKPSDSEKRHMGAGKWVRTRADGLPPGKSTAEGRGLGPPPKAYQKAARLALVCKMAGTTPPTISRWVTNPMTGARTLETTDNSANIGLLERNKGLGGLAGNVASNVWNFAGSAAEVGTQLLNPAGRISAGLGLAGKGYGMAQDATVNRDYYAKGLATGKFNEGEKLVRTSTPYRDDYGWEDLHADANRPGSSWANPGDWGSKILGHNNPLSKSLATVGLGAANGYQSLSNSYLARQPGGYTKQKNLPQYDQPSAEQLSGRGWQPPGKAAALQYVTKAAFKQDGFFKFNDIQGDPSSFLQAAGGVKGMAGDAVALGTQAAGASLGYTLSAALNAGRLIRDAVPALGEGLWNTLRHPVDTVKALSGETPKSQANRENRVPRLFTHLRNMLVPKMPDQPVRINNLIGGFADQVLTPLRKS